MFWRDERDKSNFICISPVHYTFISFKMNIFQTQNHFINFYRIDIIIYKFVLASVVYCKSLLGALLYVGRDLSGATSAITWSFIFGLI